jgi:hypothetical protein
LVDFLAVTTGTPPTSALETVTSLRCASAICESTGDANQLASAPTETTATRMKAIGARSAIALRRLTRDGRTEAFTAVGVERTRLRRRADLRRSEIFFSESFRNLRSANSR